MTDCYWHCIVMHCMHIAQCSHTDNNNTVTDGRPIWIIEYGCVESSDCRFAHVAKIPSNKDSFIKWKVRGITG